MDRRPSKILQQGEGNDDRARLWKAFEALDWKDESERKRVHMSYESLKRSYMDKRLNTDGTSSAGGSSPSSQQHMAAKAREKRPSMLERIEVGLNDIRLKHRENLMHSLEHTNQITGFSVVQMQVLQADEPLTLDYVTKLIDEVRAGRIVHEATVINLIQRASVILAKTPNVQRLDVLPGNRITVCGDIHGQLEDLLTIFELNGLPSEQNHYLFNGDFVDRGDRSCEVMIVMFALKILYPKAMHLNRGNHEARDMNTQHGFEEEVLKKYNAAVFDMFCHVFSLLPIAGIIQDKVFVVHGGMSWQDSVTVDDIEAIDRFQDVPPDDTLFEDLLWSDPCEEDGRFENERGCGCVFGQDVLFDFCGTNDFDLVIRSHECVDEGFEWWFDDRFITVFSASNYCGMCGNKGAFVIINYELEIRCVQYDATPLYDLCDQHLSHLSLQNGVVSKLCMRITNGRFSLLNHFRELAKDREHTRVVTRDEWAQGMKEVLDIDIDFLEVSDLLGLPLLGIDGVLGGPINFVSYLSRFRPVSDSTNTGLADMDDDTSSDDDDSRSPDEDKDQFTKGGEDVSRGQKRKQPNEKSLSMADSRLLSDINTMLYANRYQLESLFRFFDLTGDGLVSASEFKDGLLSLTQTMEHKFTEEEIATAVKIIYKNKTNCGLQYSEFFSGFRAAGFSTNYVPKNHALVSPVVFALLPEEVAGCKAHAEEELKSLKVKLGCQFMKASDGTLRLSGITKGKAAELAGLQTGDIVVSVDYQPTPTKKLFRQAVLAISPGQSGMFQVDRDGVELMMNVTMLSDERSFEEIQRLKRIAGGLVYTSDIDEWKEQVRIAEEKRKAEEARRRKVEEEKRRAAEERLAAAKKAALGKKGKASSVFTKTKGSKLQGLHKKSLSGTSEENSLTSPGPHASSRTPTSPRSKSPKRLSKKSKTNAELAGRSTSPSKTDRKVQF